MFPNLYLNKHTLLSFTLFKKRQEINGYLTLTLTFTRSAMFNINLKQIKNENDASSLLEAIN